MQRCRIIRYRNLGLYMTSYEGIRTHKKAPSLVTGVSRSTPPGGLDYLVPGRLLTPHQTPCFWVRSDLRMCLYHVFLLPPE
jgi:hypothetical protein